MQDMNLRYRDTALRSTGSGRLHLPLVHIAADFRHNGKNAVNPHTASSVRTTSSGTLTVPALLRRIITVLLLCAAPGVALAIGTDRTPTANAGSFPDVLPALTGGVGTTITLDGSASKERQGVADGTNANLNFAWTQVDNGAPAVTLTGADTAMPTFTSPQAPLGLTLTFSLTVTNTNGLSDTDEVSVRVRGGDGPVPPPPGFFQPENTGAASPNNPFSGGVTIVRHAGAGALTLAWIPPGAQSDGTFRLPAGTPPVLGYRVYWYATADYPGSLQSSRSSPPTRAYTMTNVPRYTVFGLPNEEHVVTVVAVNENGESDFPLPITMPAFTSGGTARHASDPCGTACLPYDISIVAESLFFSVPPTGGNREVETCKPSTLIRQGRWG